MSLGAPPDWNILERTITSALCNIDIAFKVLWDKVDGVGGGGLIKAELFSTGYYQ